MRAHAGVPFFCSVKSNKAARLLNTGNSKNYQVAELIRNAGYFNFSIYVLACGCRR
jgi:hypothetical protein